MEGGCSAASTDDNAANDPGISGQPPGEDLHVSTEDSDVSVSCKDCGLKFTDLDDYKTHLHQHALEEEEAPLRDDGTPAAAVDVGGNGDEDMGTADECAESGLAATKSEMIQSISTDSMKNPPRNFYSCEVCGKVYMYRVSFEKHKKLHDDPPLKETSQRASQAEINLPKYECPDCGLSFIRKTRLIGHLRAHRRRGQFKPKCDQCNKYFISIKTWLAHVDMHNQKRFWCLSCAHGYVDETSLDKHLQNHSLTRRDKTNNGSTQQGNITKTRPRAKNHRCPYCGKAYYHYTKFIAHKRKHFKKHPVSGFFIEKDEDIDKDSLVTSEKEEMKENREEHPEREENTQGECGDSENTDDSDCGEPLHCPKFSRPFCRADPLSEQSSGADASQTGPELVEKEPKPHREHKYWEWECTECDMGFDEMSKLHLHYIKHATGEVPIPLDYLEG
ncbi:zinc finger protein 429 isoform X3 [Cololabis saira]|uniref:zinc finger protein 429 isoform X3 n=1 Tax=Cololabis saira TaxID=129043 RepID=UPI002AD2687A|nr:zinc finger protein 429 isoform X3 [Cololabis saira]